MIKNLFFLTIFSIFTILPYSVLAQEELGQETVFNIESSHDLQKRDTAEAILIAISRTAYWYLDKTIIFTEDLENAIVALSQEFEENIYVNLTTTFGSEWNPGIDKDSRITILIHPMEDKRGGYFDSADEYAKIQVPESNEREMIYLNSQYLTKLFLVRSFLAHEFSHLISFNQKERAHNVIEEIWLNEARAEYAPTLLGYDDIYEGSNLERRVKDFLNKPSDSLTEWRSKSEDYGTASLFVQYLVDHYGIAILAESLKTKEIGINSLNEILAEKGFQEDFAEVFANWTVAVLINDCQISDSYCYFNNNLKDLKITPLVNYIPFIGDSVLSVTNTTKDWSGNWHKFVGGNGQLQLDFRAGAGTSFKLVYLIENSQGDFSIDEMVLSGGQAGKVLVPDFGSENVSLTIIPIAQNKMAGFSDLETPRLFLWTASTQTGGENPQLPSLPPLEKPVSEMSKGGLLARIAEIKAVIVKLQELLLEMISGGGELSCLSINQDLYFGTKNHPQVRCLQQFLKNQGANIYPEGLVTGNFGPLTQKAVSRFQEKYASEILTPLGLIEGTGYLGSSTRAKINQLLSQ